jgi:hypothetical protein
MSVNWYIGFMTSVNWYHGISAEWYIEWYVGFMACRSTGIMVYRLNGMSVE